MNDNFQTSHEVIGRLIRFCHQDKESALKVYDEVIVGKNHSILLPDGEIKLSQKQLEELVERFSSEVGPEIWESKSGKH